MSVKLEPLPPGLETAIRARPDNNPFVKFMGIEVPQLGLSYARFLLKVRPEFHNSQGFLQGGVITALADEAVAYALFTTVSAGEMINTVEMKINFLRPVQEGEIVAEAHIAKRGHTISLGEVTVRQGDKLVAKGMCTYIHQKP
jgi:uncharacterized protein (TIGR00369 family)